MLIRKDSPAEADPDVGFSRAADEEHLIDDLAQPFLDLAKKFETARVSDVDTETWHAILDANVFFWRFVANYLPGQLDKTVSTEMSEVLIRIGEFMRQACLSLRANRDDVLEQRVIELNLNMCAQVLNLRQNMLGLKEA
ncbi:hypothetical protein [Hwanghaeella sp.]|uniref:hypothetical protein n=1 Tax=Hwanghaeella sp. TaxID=2605943 RepID=UPI003CCB80BD